jgi:hypothetical protein
MKKKTILFFLLLINFSYNSYSQEYKYFELKKLKDVSPKHWSYKSLERVVENLGIVSPKTDNQFKGEDLATRYEVAEAFYRAAKTMELVSNLDLKLKDIINTIEITDLDDNYKELVNILINEYGLMLVHEGNKFYGNRKITRYELAYELNNYLNLLQKVVKSKDKGILNKAEQFKDLKYDHWAAESVVNIVNKYQLMKGYPDNTFKGDNTLTRYELASVLFKFVEYVDKYLIPIPKYVPFSIKMPTPKPTPTPLPTFTPSPEPTTIPTPIPTRNIRNLLPNNDIRLGPAIKSAYSGATTNNEIDFITGLNLQYYNWQLNFSNTRLGFNIDANFLGYGSILTKYHNVSNLKRNTADLYFHWRILGIDYIDETALSLGVGYGLFQWSGTGYSYTGYGPKLKVYLETPIIPYLSILLENSFLISLSENSAFIEQLKWSNELTLGVNFPATTELSGIIAYKDTRFSLGKPEIYGDIGGVALLRYRF